MPAWGSNLISEIKGDVFVGSRRIYVGDSLNSNQKLRVKSKSLVTIMCSNQATYQLKPGTYKLSDYCPAQAIRKSGSRNSPRDPFNVNLPYVISPRNTALLDSDNLFIQWNPSPGAAHYHIEIEGQDVNWTTQTNQTVAVFTGGKTLKHDYRYTIKITADNNRSSTVGFAVLPPEEVTRVRNQVDKITSLSLDPDIEAIGLAHTYKEFKHSNIDRHSFPLYQSALEVLEERIKGGTNNSQVYLLQADLYLAIGLPNIAQERYQTALSISESTNQDQRQTLSHLGLATVAERQTEYSDAIKHLKSAQSLLMRLGERDQVNVLEARIERIELEASNQL